MNNKILSVFFMCSSVIVSSSAFADAFVPAFGGSPQEARSICTDGSSPSTGFGPGAVVGYMAVNDPGTSPLYAVVCDRPDGGPAYTVPTGYALVPAFSPNSLQEARSICTDGPSPSTGFGAGTVIGYPAISNPGTSAEYAIVCLRPMQSQ